MTNKPEESVSDVQEDTIADAPIAAPEAVRKTARKPKATAKKAEELSSKLGEILDKPLSGVSNLAYTTSRVLSFILGITRGKGGNGNGS